jgi:hypothetical protein
MMNLSTIALLIEQHALPDVHSAVCIIASTKAHNL